MLIINEQLGESSYIKIASVMQTRRNISSLNPKMIIPSNQLSAGLKIYIKMITKSFNNQGK